MRKFSLLIVAAGLFLSLPTAARADFGVAYPDGAVAFAINGGPGLNVVALLNDVPDPDIFTIHSDGFSNPVLVPLFGLPVSRAMWFNFLGFNSAQRPMFAVYVNQGSGFFFVGNFFI
jgi:hypothetical protein